MSTIKLLKKMSLFVFLIVGVQVFAAPAVLAQTQSGEQLLGPDGSLIPDFSRAEQQAQANQIGGVTAPNAPASRPLGAQDPLNETYSNRASQAIDLRNNQRFNGPLRDPLSQLPRDFRDDQFIYELARQQRLALDRTGGDRWRARDDAAFDPLGIRAGSFVFYPEVYSRLITSNNLFASETNKKSDSALETRPRFRLRSDWNVHELEIFGSLTDKRWRNFTSENTLEAEIRARGRLDITQRTSIEGGVRYELRSEGRGADELPDAAAQPAKTHQTEYFGQINHRFNRLGFRLRGQLIENVFDDVSLNNGDIQNNHLRDYDETQLELRTNYEFSPRFSLFVDNGFGRREFSTKVDDNGILQGSKNWLVATGASIEFTSNLNFLGRLGYARASSDDAAIKDLQGLIYDARLIWTPTRLMTVTLNGQTQIEETTQSISAGSINRSVSLELINSLTHRLSSTVTGEYEVRDDVGIDQRDEELTIGLGLQYLFSRSLVVDFGYDYTQVIGSNAYREDEFHLGLRWRR